VQGDLSEVESTIKSGKEVLEGLLAAETIVHSAYYHAASEYYKVMITIIRM
jgi:hypothetical protein